MLSLAAGVREEDRLMDKNKVWIRDRVRRYLEAKKNFLHRLHLAIYLTGGQPARGPELGSIKFRNSRLSDRNIFIYRGLVCYATKYIKL